MKRALLFAAWLLSCGGDDAAIDDSLQTDGPSEPGDVNRSVEELVTITRGVYGQALFFNDVCPGCGYLYGAGFVGAFVGEANMPSTVVEVGERGFFEIALEPGPYDLCWSDGDFPEQERGFRCISAWQSSDFQLTVDEADQKLSRWDVTVQPGLPGWWPRVAEP